jgi:ATP-dependent DNA helicase RecG
LLGRLGALLPGERLSQAGALVFCPADRNYLTVTVFDVEGGDVTASTPDLRGPSLLERMALLPWMWMSGVWYGGWVDGVGRMGMT